MLLRGLQRLDSPAVSKTPVLVELMVRCYQRLRSPSHADCMLWGVLSTAFFFLLRRFEICANGRTFQWFALRDDDILVVDHRGQSTLSPASAVAVVVSLRGSKTNQNGPSTVRRLSRSGHQFLCPVFGALCMKLHRGRAPSAAPAAAYVTQANRLRAVSSAAVKFVLQDAARSLGLDPSSFTPHSLRAGGATQMYRAGVDSLTIQFHGRWASDAYKLYTRLHVDTAATIAPAMVGPGRLGSI